MWLDTFNEMRKQSGMSLDELCEKSGIPKGTLSKITSGVTKSPSLDTMKTLVYAMGYTLKDLDDGIESSDTLSKKERSHIKKYRSLDPYGKEAVDGVLDVEFRRCEADRQADRAAALREQRQQMETGEMQEPEKVIRFRVPEYVSAMSAGTGEEANLEFPQDVELAKAPPRGTSYIAHVNGQSMEPTYRNGEKLFVHACEEIPVGKIGVFLMDGQQYVKELGDGVLISHNSDQETYHPLPFTEDIRCQGLVLGVCDESYFE